MAGGGGRGTAGVGCPPLIRTRSTPARMVMSSVPTNRYVGTAKTVPASRTPRSLKMVMTIRRVLFRSSCSHAPDAAVTAKSPCTNNHLAPGSACPERVNIRSSSRLRQVFRHQPRESRYRGHPPISTLSPQRAQDLPRCRRPIHFRREIPVSRYLGNALDQRVLPPRPVPPQATRCAQLRGSCRERG